MKSHELVAQSYRKNVGSAFSLSNNYNHTLTIDMSDWPIGDHQIKLDHNDCPYLKLALIDRHLEEEYVE